MFGEEERTYRDEAGDEAVDLAVAFRRESTYEKSTRTEKSVHVTKTVKTFMEPPQIFGKHNFVTFSNYCTLIILNRTVWQ